MLFYPARKRNRRDDISCCRGVSNKKSSNASKLYFPVSSLRGASSLFLVLVLLNSRHGSSRSDLRRRCCCPAPPATPPTATGRRSPCCGRGGGSAAAGIGGSHAPRRGSCGRLLSFKLQARKDARYRQFRKGKIEKKRGGRKKEKIRRAITWTKASLRPSRPHPFFLSFFSSLFIRSQLQVKIAEHVLTGHKVAIKILNRKKIKQMDMEEKGL